MTRLQPALLGISHGTSSSEGRAAVRALHEAVATAIAERAVTAGADATATDATSTDDAQRAPSVRLGHVDVEQPDVPATLATLEPGEPAVVVPLLLSAGYHVHVDLTEAVAEVTDRSVVLAGALGPDDRLAAVLARRLDEAGVRDDDSVVLSVAGSSDGRAVRDCRDMAKRLAAACGRDIRLGFLSAASPLLIDAIAQAREDAPGARVVVASYLLAPGYFQDLAEAAGADVVSAPLLTPDLPVPAELVEIVLDRYDAAAG
ncbi:cobalamin biosynthesis protein CbiX [Agromyces sp. SYSU K20354]|uniref:sirohydrochlorin chelatase n=1 Tax=Agromyces cavernae TaxID=2898659 RepID=UPI001E3DD7F5|nr:CbiX/SirB N-terminal domain-containing protein [Agromyces cavernae]MCD2441030.1 cobalamin biosynthesis protein CbiX [Agromyces cavernae]